MENQLLNVTDLTSYLFCPRKFYLRKVKGLKEPPNKAMTEGLIRHNVLEEFSNYEKQFIQSLPTLDEISLEKKFQVLLDLLIDKVFSQQNRKIQEFEISKHELHKKIKEAMENEISLRIHSIMPQMSKGILGNKLWENLTPKYISELPLISEKLGLKGRADRVLIDDENKKIIPFELKTRKTDKVWPSDEIQLTSYAMMLEEKFQQKIPIGILESGNIKHEIEITEDKKQKVIELIDEVNYLIKNGKTKPGKNFTKCFNCPTEEICDELG